VSSGYIKTDLNSTALYDKILNAFYDEVEEVAEGVPYMVTVGMENRTMQLPRADESGR